MKKSLLLILMLLCTLPLTLQAQNDRNRPERLSREEFQNHLESYLTKYAELTSAEAEKFFPLYNEWQAKKREYNEGVHKIMSGLRDGNASEAQYKNALESLSNNAIASSTLDKVYFEKFKDVISYKKIFKIREAESRFRQELVRGMGRGSGRPNGPRGQVPDAPNRNVE